MLKHQTSFSRNSYPSKKFRRCTIPKTNNSTRAEPILTRITTRTPKNSPTRCSTGSTSPPSYISISNPEKQLDAPLPANECGAVAAETIPPYVLGMVKLRFLAGQLGAGECLFGVGLGSIKREWRQRRVGLVGEHGLHGSSVEKMA